MSEEQKKFDDLMKKVIKVSPEELKRRLEEQKKSDTQSAKLAKPNKNA